MDYENSFSLVDMSHPLVDPLVRPGFVGWFYWKKVECFGASCSNTLEGQERGQSDPCERRILYISASYCTSAD